LNNFRVVLITLLIMTTVKALYAGIEIQSSTVTVLEIEYDDTLSNAGMDTEELENYLYNPLNINSCTVEDLMVFPWLSKWVAIDIIKYRTKNGYFKTLSEIRKVKSLDKDTYEKIRVYIVARDPWTKTRGNVQVRLKLDKPDTKEYINAPWPYHNPEYVYNKFNLYLGDYLETGYTLRRDLGTAGGYQGAPEFNLENAYRYFLSKYWIQVSNLWFVQRAVAGNYKVQFNQGLVFYGSGMLGISRPVVVNSKGISRDTGSNPNTNYHGIAVDTKFKKLLVTLLYSDKLYDVTLSTNGYVKTKLPSISANMGYIADTVNPGTGYRKLREQLIGGRVGYALFGGETGVIGYTANYSPELRTVLDTGEYEFQGTVNTVTGIYANYRFFDKLGLYTEYALCSGNGDAWIVQTEYNLGNIVIYNNFHGYSKNYYNFHGGAIGEEETNKNEQGAVLAMQYKIKGTEMFCYYGYYHHPLPEDTVEPKTTNVLSWEYKQLLTTKLTLFFSEKDEFSTENFKLTPPSVKYIDQPVHSSKTRVQMDWSAGAKTTVRVKLEQKRKNINGDKFNCKYYGYLYLAGLKHELMPGLQLDTRAVFFDGPQDEIYLSDVEPLWDRIYSSYLFNPLGKGIRYYVVLKQKASENVSVWVAYENTEYIDIDDADSLVKYPKHAFKLQVSYKW